MKVCLNRQLFNTRLHTKRPLFTTLLMFLPLLSWGQSTPAEFAELSLQDLFNAPAQQAAYTEGSWQFGYQTDESTSEGYRHGTKNLNNEAVLWRASEVRTPHNYPIIPTQITQRVHSLSLGHQLTQNWHLRSSLPYIEQKTEHISIVPNYNAFTIKSSGIGDLNLIATRNISDSSQGLWWLSVGISLPTGSIDEQGDTPRDTGAQQLPYTMQLGSGTYDLPLKIAYRSFEQDAWTSNWDLSLSAKLRFAYNDREYRLGNHYLATASKSLRITDGLTVSLGGDIKYIDTVKGADKEILLSAPNPFPASIADPDNYGGLTSSLRARISIKPTEKQEVQLEAAAPIHQDLNGLQPKAQWSLRLGFNYTL